MTETDSFDSLSVPHMIAAIMLELVENLFAMFLFWGTFFPFSTGFHLNLQN